MKDGSIVIKTKTKFKQAGPGKSEVLGSGGQQVLNARAKTNDELETRASLKGTRIGRRRIRIKVTLFFHKRSRRHLNKEVGSFLSLTFLRQCDQSGSECTKAPRWHFIGNRKTPEMTNIR